MVVHQPPPPRQFLAAEDAARQLCTILAWSVAWSVCFVMSLRFLTPSRRVTRQSASSLPTRAKQLEWASRVVSTPHAIGTAVGAVYGLSVAGVGVWDGHEQRWAWWEDIVLMSAGYFLYDLLLVAIFMPELSDRAGTIAHHTIALVLHWVPVCGFRGYVGPSMMGYLAELSTPLLNLRWFLLKSSRSQTVLYAANGLALVMVFLACRLGVGVVYMDVVVWQPWFVGADASSSAAFLASIGVFGKIIPILTAAFFCLNVYWSALLVQAALSALFPALTSKKQKQKV
jgi:hypothetical protein